MYGSTVADLGAVATGGSCVELRALPGLANGFCSELLTDAVVSDAGGCDAGAKGAGLGGLSE